MRKSNGLYGGSRHLLGAALALSISVAGYAYVTDDRLLLELTSSVAAASLVAGLLEPERHGDAEDDASAE